MLQITPFSQMLQITAFAGILSITAFGLGTSQMLQITVFQKDAGTTGPEDHGTRGPWDQRTTGPKDQSHTRTEPHLCKKKLDAVEPIYPKHELQLRSSPLHP